MEQNKAKKVKSEVEELNEIFAKFQKGVENYQDIEGINYEEIYRKNEMVKHFNNRIIQCNKLCITHPEIKMLLYEEENCLNTCRRKNLEVEGVVKKYMNTLNMTNQLNPYKEE